MNRFSLDNIKCVGFIQNFNNKGSYPEFAYVAPVVENKPVHVVVEKKRKGGNAEVKAARKGASWLNSKPVLLYTNKM